MIRYSHTLLLGSQILYQHSENRLWRSVLSNATAASTVCQKHSLLTCHLLTCVCVCVVHVAGCSQAQRCYSKQWSTEVLRQVSAWWAGELSGWTSPTVVSLAYAMSVDIITCSWYVSVKEMLTSCDVVHVSLLHFCQGVWVCQQFM